ncbi:MAG TPA: FAD-binding protein, partial [Vulgatibacter sp.]
AAPEREGQRGPDEAVDRESAAAERETAAREDEAERVAARHDRTGGLGAGDGERARERHAFHLDRSRLTGIDPVDERAMWIRAYAGAAVADVEARLRARGLTLGSQPPSIFLGTVGDWLEGPFAGRRVEGDRLASGVASVEAVLEGGLLLISHAAPRSAAGPAVAQLLLGGGGRQGQLVAATLKAEPFPRTTRFAFAGPAKTLARWLLACVRDPLPPIRIEAIGGDPPSANLTFAAGTDRLAARNGRAMALARSLGLQEVAPPGVREPAGQGAGTELETEKWLDQLASLPAGTRLDLFRISRESAVVVEGRARKEGWSPDGSTRLGQIR